MSFGGLNDAAPEDVSWRRRYPNRKVGGDALTISQRKGGGEVFYIRNEGQNYFFDYYELLIYFFYIFINKYVYSIFNIYFFSKSLKTISMPFNSKLVY